MQKVCTIELSVIKFKNKKIRGSVKIIEIDENIFSEQK